MVDIGSKIKELRIVNGLSQQDLAKKLNAKQNTLSRYENNLARPSYEILVSIAEIFDVSTDYLLGVED